MLKADFVPESWDGEEPEFSEVLVGNCPDMESKIVDETIEKIILISPKEQVKILIQKYPSLIRAIRNSDKSAREFIEMFIFNMEGYLKPVPSNALKDAKKKYSDLYETYSVLFSKRNGGLDGYLESPNKIDDQTLRPLYEVREEIWMIEQKIYWRDYVKGLIGLTTNTPLVEKRVVMANLNFLMENSKFIIKKKKEKIVKTI